MSKNAHFPLRLRRAYILLSYTIEEVLFLKASPDFEKSKKTALGWCNAEIWNLKFKPIELIIFLSDRLNMWSVVYLFRNLIQLNLFLDSYCSSFDMITFREECIEFFIQKKRSVKRLNKHTGRFLFLSFSRLPSSKFSFSFSPFYYFFLN